MKWDRLQLMIRIAITAAAYAAIRESLPVAKKPSLRRAEGWGGLYLVSVPMNTMNKLMALRRPSEATAT